jgi:hypothetical protein
LLSLPEKRHGVTLGAGQNGVLIDAISSHRLSPWPPSRIGAGTDFKGRHGQRITRLEPSQSPYKAHLTHTQELTVYGNYRLPAHPNRVDGTP